MPTEREIEMLRAAREAGMASPEELSNFMAQISAESGNLAKLDEGFAYTRGIQQIGPRWARRQGLEVLEEARQQALAGNSEPLAELMYGGRMGNDNPGDGYLYRGRGYIQLTGRDNYTAAGLELNMDLAGNPNLAAEPQNAARIAVWYWQQRVPPSQREDVLQATHRVNGGEEGLAQRYAQFERWRATLTPEFVSALDVNRIDSGDISSDRIAGSVRTIQQNLNAMGITDARGQSLVVDGNRGGSGSHTNEAIAAFQRQVGLSGETSTAHLLSATAVALRTRQTLDFDQTLHDVLPETMHQAPSPRMVNGVPDYLLHGRDLAGRAAGSPIPTRDIAATLASTESSAPRPLPVTRTLQPGDHGEAVWALQEHLRGLGARDRHDREIESDRDYGPRTRDAVEQFQLWAGHEPTGIADAQTLRDLQVQGQYAARQRANGIAASDHISGNLMHAPGDLTDAAVQRPVQGSGVTQMPVQKATPSAALMPYSDANHPKHQLYSELKGTLESMGHPLSEDRLHQITGKMDLNGLRAGPQNRYVFSNDNNTLYVVSDIPGFRAHQSLEESAPPVGQTMQQVQAEQVTQAKGLERMTQMSRMHTPNAGPTMGVH